MSQKTEIRDWKAEVDSEMARLIRLGVPPYDAAIQARQRVSAKRRALANAEPGPSPS